MSSRVIPSLRYRDAKRAVNWLQDGFGFEPHLVVEGDDGRIEHAQFTYGSGMIMFGSSREGEYDEFVTAGADGGRATIGLYVVVDDVDAHADTARAAGAEIVMEPEDQDYGGRLYTCLDFEGNVWSFGSYDPWRTD